MKDGVIEDPRACHFNPAVLTCKSGDADDCLTEPQVVALTKIYSGAKNPRTGAQILPGWSPGVEGEPGAWSAWIIPGANRTPAQFMFANTYYGQAVCQGPQVGLPHPQALPRTFVTATRRSVRNVINSNSPDLRSFRARGGKLIQYHGWGDAAVAPIASIEYYERVKLFMSRFPDPRSESSTHVDDFYRLFMVHGIGHCAGGNGPNVFGNRPGAPVDADHDVVVALEQWVEKGVTPKQLIGAGKGCRKIHPDTHASPVRLSANGTLQRNRRHEPGSEL